MHHIILKISYQQHQIHLHRHLQIPLLELHRDRSDKFSTTDLFEILWLIGRRVKV